MSVHQHDPATDDLLRLLTLHQRSLVSVDAVRDQILANRKSLVRHLHTECGLSMSQIARPIGVSKSMVQLLLK